MDSTCRSNAAKPSVWLLDERAVVTAAFEHVLGDAGQQRKIAADVRLDVQARQSALPNSRLRGSLGTRKLTSPISFSRIDDDDVAAAAAHGHQAAKQARMVGRRIAADEHEQIAAFDILELHGGRARSQARCQTDTARLMAVVRAVVDVVGPERAREELQQESRFVGRAAAGVKETAARSGCLQLVRDAAERVVPGDDAVVRVSRRRRRSDRRAGRTTPARAARAMRSWAME